MKTPGSLRVVVQALVVAAVVGPACGRTDIDPAAPCLPTDTTRPCTDVCGEGTQACIDGTWRACVVAPVTRACTGTCGEGTQQCVNRTWLACEIPVATRSCLSACGNGKEICIDGLWGPCYAPMPKAPTLHAVIRDFHATHPDFELPIFGDHLDTGIVADMLGPDNKPVYAGNPTTPTTSGAASFNQWYNDVPGQNETTAIELPLTDQTGLPGFYIYDNRSFFPIDGQLFGNEGNPHNYHFTMESHTHFTYVPGQIFDASGDDDVFVFINRRLAINLGGIHQTLSASVDLDAQAQALGLTPGGSYDLDIFFAERHTFGSTLMVRTSIADASSCE
jgi:fibro-slime domain-containing protein